MIGQEGHTQLMFRVLIGQFDPPCFMFRIVIKLGRFHSSLGCSLLSGDRVYDWSGGSYAVNV